MSTDGRITELRAKYVPLRRLGDVERSGTPTTGVAGDLRIRVDPATVRVVDALERSDVGAELPTPAGIEARAAVRRYEIVTFGGRPSAETTPVLASRGLVDHGAAPTTNPRRHR